jgi:hypothetical protein
MLVIPGEVAFEGLIGWRESRVVSAKASHNKIAVGEGKDVGVKSQDKPGSGGWFSIQEKKQVSTET